MQAKRLTNNMRQEIINKCIKTTLSKREAALNKRLASIGDKVYRVSVPANIERKMKQLPNGYFQLSSRITVEVVIDRKGSEEIKYAFISAKMQRRHYARRSTSFDLTKSRMAPHSLNQGRYIVEAKHDVAKEIIQLDKDFNAYENDINNLRREIRGIVESVNTVKKLQEAWPESEKYLPGEVPKPQPMVVSPDKVNNLIQQLQSA